MCSYCFYGFTSSIQRIPVPRGAHMTSSSLFCRRQFYRRSSLICRPVILRRAHMGDISLFCRPPLRRDAYMGSICLSADHESPDQLCPFELHSPHLQAEVVPSLAIRRSTGECCHSASLLLPSYEVIDGVKRTTYVLRPAEFLIDT